MGRLLCRVGLHKWTRRPYLRWCQRRGCYAEQVRARLTTDWSDVQTRRRPC